MCWAAFAIQCSDRGCNLLALTLDDKLSDKLHNKVALLKEWGAGNAVVGILYGVEPIGRAESIKLTCDILRAIEAYAKQRSVVVGNIAVRRTMEQKHRCGLSVKLWLTLA